MQQFKALISINGQKLIVPVQARDIMSVPMAVIRSLEFIEVQEARPIVLTNLNNYPVMTEHLASLSVEMLTRELSRIDIEVSRLSSCVCEKCTVAKTSLKQQRDSIADEIKTIKEANSKKVYENN